MSSRRHRESSIAEAKRGRRNSTRQMHRPGEATRRLAAEHERRGAIARLLPLWPYQLADASDAGRLSILAKLRKALRAERRRGIAGHWSYDLARHAELLRMYREEQAALTTRTAACYGQHHPRNEAVLPKTAFSTAPDPTSRAGFRAPSVWQAATGPPHNSEPPWGNRAADPTSHGIPREKGCSGYANAASKT